MIERPLITLQEVRLLEAAQQYQAWLHLGMLRAVRRRLACEHAERQNRMSLHRGETWWR